MTRFYFVPEDWVMSDKLLAWTKEMGLTDDTIERELESFKDHQYRRPMMRADACWRNWVKNGIKWGSIVPVQEKQYRTVEELSDEQRRKDRELAEANFKRLRAVK